MVLLGSSAMACLNSFSASDQDHSQSLAVPSKKCASASVSSTSSAFEAARFDCSIPTCRGQKVKKTQKTVSVRQPSPGRCVSRVFLEGFFEVLDTLPQTILSPLIPFVATLEISFVRLGCNWAPSGQTNLLLR